MVFLVLTLFFPPFLFTTFRKLLINSWLQAVYPLQALCRSRVSAHYHVMKTITFNIWQGRVRQKPVNHGHAHRVPPHGPSHRSHCSGVSCHLSEAFVRHRLSKLHVPQKYPQCAAGEGVYQWGGGGDRGDEWETGPDLINQSQTSGSTLRVYTPKSK